MTDDAPAAEADAPAATPDAPAVPEQPETVTMPAQEAAALRRRVAEAEKASRKLEAEQKKAKEEREAEQGKWKELAEQREQALQKAEANNARIEREQRITRLASKAKFLDPTDVIGRISPEDGQDDGLTEAALARIAESSPHLIAKEQQAPPEIGQVLTPAATPDTGPKPPPGKAPLRTIEDVEALPDSEFDARYAEVQAVLRTSPQ